MIRLLLRSYYVTVYYLSWVWFGIGGLLLNLGCGLLLPFTSHLRIGHKVRSTIQGMFALWLKWFHACRVVRIHWRGFDTTPLQPGTVYVANHPTLVDAPVLLSRLPDTICIFKPALSRNPCIGPAAVLAGYSSGDSGVDLIRDTAEQVAAGRSLLIFPEGTRTTPGRSLNPLKPGFALIAKRAGAPIRLITLRASPLLTAKGRAWWKVPSLPGWIEVTLQDEIPADTELSAGEITALAQERLASLVLAASSLAPQWPVPPPTSC